MKDDKDFRVTILDKSEDKIKHFLMMTGMTRAELEKMLAEAKLRDDNVWLTPIEGADPALRDKFTMPF